ncbi:MAG: hypothetical protein Q9211_001823 [Gyalolechia sp. 1 TL-2023]
MHRRGCPLFREEDEITKMSFDISFVNRLVNTAARISLSLQYGAGGMSISPGLTLRGLRRANSQLFVLIKNVELTGKHLAGSIPKFVEILPRIKYLVQNGQFSPYDVDENGRTVFEVLMDVNNYSTDEGELRLREPRDHFIKSLCYLGFPSNEESDVGSLREG